MATIIEQLKDLETKRNALLEQAKTEALTAATKAVADLNALGFHYALVEGNTPTRTTPTATRGPRKGGVSENVLAAIKAAPDGLARAGVLAALGADDTKAEQSISNALSNLKKAGKLTAEGGIYKAT